MTATVLEAIHVYEHDRRTFEADMNQALKNIMEMKGVIADIKYAIDASTGENSRGGFGALIIFEHPEGDPS